MSVIWDLETLIWRSPCDVKTSTCTRLSTNGSKFKQQCRTPGAHWSQPGSIPALYNYSKSELTQTHTASKEVLQKSIRFKLFEVISYIPPISSESMSSAVSYPLVPHVHFLQRHLAHRLNAWIMWLCDALCRHLVLVDSGLMLNSACINHICSSVLLN